LEENLLQSLPSVEVLISTSKGVELAGRFGRELALNGVRHILGRMRKDYLADREVDLPEQGKISDWIMNAVENHLFEKYSPSLRKAINATGVVLHTGLGRAVLPESAAEEIKEITKGYCTLATDVDTGRRGHRDDHLNGLVCEITGAEAATVVNNNSAATILVLNTLAKGKEVILSRGQLVEIGGSFRMPEVMEASGAKLRDVGTTNKTHLKDYASAVCENTGAIMRVHHSNYRILGFSSEPGIEELTELAHERGLPIIDDIGSGALVDLSQFGLESEPMVQGSIKCGVDVCCFSGDKLIGGPQSGVIVGKAEIVSRIKKNPLSRAFRIGKLTIAAMEATLKLFLKPDEITSTHPVYQMFSAPVDQLERRALKMQKALKARLQKDVVLSVIDGHSQVGSGAVPVETIPSKLLSVQSASFPAGELAGKLRHFRPGIFPRVHKEAVYFDFRTIHKDEDKFVLDALIEILA
jgi:L-seryl-tRNA(Ser) seleniumtransferase